MGASEKKKSSEFFPRVASLSRKTRFVEGIFLFTFLISHFAFSQVKTKVVDFNLDSALKKYTFIKADSGKLHNDSIALRSFYEKLYQLKTTGKGKVNVAHIGDSHIQADFFSGVVRQHFHLDFENAGR